MQELNCEKLEKLTVNDFPVGSSHRACICNGDGDYKIHTLAHVEGMVVFKYYGKHKKYWHYKIESPYKLGFEKFMYDKKVK